MTRSKLLTEKEVSEWLGLAVTTLQTMRYRPGKDPIPFTKVAGKVRYREELVQKWIERNTFSDSFESKEHRKAG